MQDAKDDNMHHLFPCPERMGDAKPNHLHQLTRKASALLCTGLMMVVLMMTGLAISSSAHANVPHDDLIADDGRVLNYEPIPLARPDVALSYGGQEVVVAIPKPRPTIEDAFGTSTATLSEMVAKESTAVAASETSLSLQSGETLSRIMQRAGFTKRDGANIIQLLAKRINVRRLQIGMTFTVAYDSQQAPIGLHFKDKEAVSYTHLRAPRDRG